jgi:hypothetical protein
MTYNDFLLTMYNLDLDISIYTQARSKIAREATSDEEIMNHFDTPWEGNHFLYNQSNSNISWNVKLLRLPVYKLVDHP